VWDLLEETIDGTTCKSCGKSFSGTTLTSSLKWHLAKHQMSQPDEQPFNEQTADHLIASLVITAGLPFLFVDNPELRALLHYLHQSYAPPSQLS